MVNRLRSLRTFHQILGFRDFCRAAVTLKPIVLPARLNGLAAPVFVRVPTTDLNTYKQVILRHEYDLRVRRQPYFIVDAGANIGMASISLANQFPHARIVSVEPEKDNYDLLVKNIAPYPNITPLRGALWSEATKLSVIDPGLGSWSFRVGSKINGSSAGTARDDVSALTIETILRDFGVEKIDLLKIDIEGSELEVFKNATAWINHVDSLIIELHERFRPGCNRAFYNATNGFDHEWLQGELVFLTRDNGCLVPQDQAALAWHPPSRY